MAKKMNLTAPEEVRELVDKFAEHRDSYRRGSYNETQVRQDFLDPLFIALGWDVYNRQGYAEAYRDVILEHAMQVEAAVRAPDYCFRIGGISKFFVEAKRPSVDIRSDVGPAFQLRRYAWTAKLPLSILTDFEEFAVYDCTVKPDRRDKASTARVKYLTFDQYVDQWEEIAGVFSRDAILRGSFDKYAESKRKKRGTAEVDEAFLDEIETWREALARNLSLRNRSLTSRELNFSVQRIIDRIIFLRMCEGRGIEPYGRLQSLLNSDRVYSRLVEMFYRADAKYNAGLFHFQHERGRELPDELTTGLVVDDKVLKDIVRRLYYPESPYEFAALPADILGQVYEQFLGKVIRLTAGHRARIEEKPEVRKAGGVYYTPTYIVEYIVENTVGKLLEGKSPQKVGGVTTKWKPAKKGRPISVLDPACGSGSFLIVAYQYLLDWYLKQYTEVDDPQKHARGANPRVRQSGRGDWRLTITERKRILLAHIYGVDLDNQAVEVTKLSLLLKCLEGETEQTLKIQLRMFDDSTTVRSHDRALPDLGNNIKCGNSLVGPDFYERTQLSLLDEDERLKINVFDWQSEFRAIMEAGGFDTVMGNPPYIRIQTMQETAPHSIEYYKHHYRSAVEGNYDIYVLFVERGLELLSREGRLGFILSHKFFNAKYGCGLRRLIAEGGHLQRIVHFGHQQVFSGPTTYTCLLFLGKSPSPNVEYVSVADLGHWKAGAVEPVEVPADRFGEDEWNVSTGPAAALFDRLANIPVKLGDIASNIFQGLVTSADAVYLLDPVGEPRDGLVPVRSRATDKQYELEREVVWPLCKGALDVRRYRASPSKRVLFPYDVVRTSETGKTALISAEEFATKYPRSWTYLLENAERLKSRERGKMRHAGWYGYVYPKSVSLFSRRKLLTPSIAQSASYTLDTNGELYFVGSGGGGGGGYGIILKPDCPWDYRFVLGLLNSRLVDFFVKAIASTFRGGYWAYSRQYIQYSPMLPIDRDVQHDRMTDLVQTMLNLQHEVASATTSHSQIALRRQIEATDHEIDRLVYELYRLTEEEIRLVEDANP